MKTLLASVAIGVAVGVGVTIALLVGGSAKPEASKRPAPPRRVGPAVVQTPVPARTAVANPAAINQQDRVSHGHDRREREAFDQRPLLRRLPLTYRGIQIDIAGLAADNRTVLIAIDADGLPPARARALYREALRHFGDPGTTYRARFVP